MELSQNGWPIVPAGNTIDTTPIDGVRVRRFHIVNRRGKTICDIWLRDGVAGFLLAYTIASIDAMIEPVAQKQLDDWGYAIRPIRGSSEPSNHGSATAADVNATKHPLGSIGTFNAAQRFQIRRLTNRLCGTIRWGGTFLGRKDEMHWELNTLNMSSLILVAHKIAKTRRGRRIMRANPGLHKAVFQ